MDKRTAYKKVKAYAELVYAMMPSSRVIMFGSYVNGTQGEDSDLDVAVVVDELVGDFLDLAIRLYQLRHSVDDRIEPVLLIAGKDRSGFLETILKTGYIVSKAS